VVALSSATAGSGTGSWIYEEAYWGTCQGGYDLSIVKQNNPPTYNATGLWTYYTSGGWSDFCAADPDGTYWTSISQNGDTFTFTNESGIFAGRITDNRYLSSITYEEDGGRTTQNIFIDLDRDGQSELLSGSGYQLWTWTDGEYSCSGGSNIDLQQNPAQTDYDASGVWHVMLESDGSEADVSVTQNGNTFRFVDFEGTQIGLASGNDYISISSYPETHGYYQTVGTTTSSIYFTLDDESTGTGWIELYWTDGWNWDWWFDGFSLTRVSTAAPPASPTLLAPVGGVVVLSLTPALRTDPFPDSGDAHRQTEWQIGTTDDFSTTVLISPSYTNLTSLTVPMFTLAGDTTYYWRARFYGSDLTASTWSEVESFHTPTITNDENSNGIPDDQENTTEDLNNDRILDAQQTNIIKTLDTVIGNAQVGASLRNAVGVTDGNIIAIDSVESTDPREDPNALSLPNRPFEMPQGLLTISVSVVKPTDTAEITVYFSEAAPEDATWFMYDPVSGWVNYEAKGLAKFSEDRKSITIKLKDWGHGDADGTANAVIVDPGGFGFAAFVVGTVKNQATQEIITDAEIRFSGTLPGEDLVLHTTAEGNFLTPLYPDTYAITASAPGYSTLYDLITVQEAAAQQVKDLLLVPASNDRDGDGVDDDTDAFPDDPTEWLDTDADGIGNNTDTDDDADGQLDVNETACGSDPLNGASVSADNDADNSPDCVDADDDNDGTLDTDDDFPFNTSESVDTDGDGTGNNTDTDDDNDGMPDVWEAAHVGLDPLVDDASQDPDNDGYSNIEEYNAATNPSESNSRPGTKALPFLMLLLGD
jgi:hypothetical protein